MISGKNHAALSVPVANMTLHSGDRSGAYLWIVLLLTLGLSGFLAYQAHDIARSHRASTDAALRDYAGFALWEFERALTSRLEPKLRDAMFAAQFGSLGNGEGASATAKRGLALDMAKDIRQTLQWCRCNESFHDFFILDVGSRVMDNAEPRDLDRDGNFVERQIAESGGWERPLYVEKGKLEPSEHGRRILRRTVATPASIRLARLPGKEDRLLVVSLMADQGGRPQEARGFVVDIPKFVAAAAADVLATVPLLPPSLTRNVSGSGLLSLNIEDEKGGRIFADGPEISRKALSASALLTTRLGTFRVLTAVRPEVARHLIIGGVPESRLPLLAGVFLLTVVLISVAYFQLRRRDELHQLRSDFVSGTSHELRTPLAQIALFSELLESTELAEDQRKRSLQIIRQEAMRLGFLVENVLRFARSERGLERAAKSEEVMGDLLRSVIEAFLPLAAVRDNRITLEVPEQPIFAEVDADAMRQVLLNLLDNAVKYGPRGQTVTVGLAQTPRETRIWVEDEGPGIPEVDRTRIWQPYRRLARDQNSASTGSGIGLAIVSRLMQTHDGRAWVEDGHQGGARFVVALRSDTSSIRGDDP